MPRELTHEEKAELANMYHLAKAVCNSRYEQMLYASKHFNKKYPEISSTWAYKQLDRMNNWRY